MTSEEPALELRDVSYVVGGHAAVDGVDLRVAAGERVALLGASGAGKSTLLRLMSGAVSPSGGKVSVLGQPLADVTGQARRRVLGRVATLTQDLALIEQVRVLHNVNAGRLGAWSVSRALRALVTTRPDEVASAALDEVGLGWAAHARVELLSGGERQRVALARLLVQDADVVVADEPVSSLDPATSARVLRLLCGPDHASGRMPGDASGPRLGRAATTIVSLHQPELARDHFTRVVGLRDGRVVLDVPMSDLRVAHLDELYAAT